MFLEHVFNFICSFGADFAPARWWPCDYQDLSPSQLRLRKLNKLSMHFCFTKLESIDRNIFLDSRFSTFWTNSLNRKLKLLLQKFCIFYIRIYANFSKPFKGRQQMLLSYLSIQKCSSINAYPIVSKLHKVVKRKFIYPLDQNQNRAKKVCCSSCMVLTSPGGHCCPWLSHGNHLCLFMLQRWFIDVLEEFRSSWELTCPGGEYLN